MAKKSYYIIAIVTVTLFSTGLHFATMAEFSPNVVLEELYYLPLLLGVLRFGPRGAIVTWLFVSTAYLPFFFSPWTTSPAGYLDRALHLVLSGVIAFVVGVLVERERRNRAQVERERYLASIGRVATVIVHDLKNPLISILGFARRISEGKGNNLQAAQTIMESAQTMQKIVNNVLDFARPLQLEIQPCTAEETILRAVEACRTKAVERGVPLSINTPAEPTHIRIDNIHVERALVNLIDNAVDASHSGKQVQIRSGSDREGLFIIIKDCGEGMSSETLTHLFEPFYSTKSTGTGLGMPIARKIVEEHGGTLAISSKQGVGTEAIVRLPISAKNE